MLDAGSALNHREYLPALTARVDALHVVTLTYEGVAFPEGDISYVFSDLRSLPYRDGYFDTIASISTLEHVGMDNTGYGSSLPTAVDPNRELELAVRELVRVLAPGGRLFVTVPYGEPEHHGWFRQFGADDVDRLVETAAPAAADVRVYEHGAAGWQLSSPDAATLARYRPDVGANAVACLCLRT
jgi:SAM-dependent methyltransferase